MPAGDSADGLDVWRGSRGWCGSRTTATTCGGCRWRRAGRRSRLARRRPRDIRGGRFCCLTRSWASAMRATTCCWSPIRTRRPTTCARSRSIPPRARRRGTRRSSYGTFLLPRLGGRAARLGPGGGDPYRQRPVRLAQAGATRRGRRPGRLQRGPGHAGRVAGLADRDRGDQSRAWCIVLEASGPHGPQLAAFDLNGNPVPYFQPPVTRRSLVAAREPWAPPDTGKYRLTAGLVGHLSRSRGRRVRADLRPLLHRRRDRAGRLPRRCLHPDRHRPGHPQPGGQRPAPRDRLLAQHLRRQLRPAHRHRHRPATPHRPRPRRRRTLPQPLRPPKKLSAPANPPKSTTRKHKHHQSHR